MVGHEKQDTKCGMCRCVVAAEAAVHGCEEPAQAETTATGLWWVHVVPEGMQQSSSTGRSAHLHCSMDEDDQALVDLHTCSLHALQVVLLTLTLCVCVSKW